MEKFCEVLCLIIVLMLFYLIWRSERFVATFTDALASRQFNFGRDAAGYSEADKFLATQLNRV